MTNEQYLYSTEVLQSLDKFRDRIVRSASFSDYTSQVAEELLQYAHTIDGNCTAGMITPVTTDPPVDGTSLLIPKRN